MICNICGEWIDGEGYTMRFEEGPDKGRFIFLHKKCAEENYVSVEEKS